MTVRFNPKGFAQTDLLKSVQPANLVRLLEPCRTLFAERGLVLPEAEPWELDYPQLSAILAEPDEWIDSHVI